MLGTCKTETAHAGVASFLCNVNNFIVITNNNNKERTLEQTWNILNIYTVQSIDCV